MRSQLVVQLWSLCPLSVLNNSQTTLIMEHAAGGSLATLLKDKGALPEAKAAAIIAEVPYSSEFTPTHSYVSCDSI